MSATISRHRVSHSTRPALPRTSLLGSLVLAGALAVTGCGDGSDTSNKPSTGDGGSGPEAGSGGAAGRGGSGGRAGVGGAAGVGGRAGSGGRAGAGGQQAGGAGGVGGQGGAAGAGGMGGQMTPEGCLQGETCSCVAGAGVCQGPNTLQPCEGPADCGRPTATCAALTGMQKVCIVPCQPQGGCNTGGAMCPDGFQCMMPAGGLVPQNLCVQNGTPPSCMTAEDCQGTLPGATCLEVPVLGGLCALPCTP